jgi:hypothetical protein
VFIPLEEAVVKAERLTDTSGFHCWKQGTTAEQQSLAGFAHQV